MTPEKLIEIAQSIEVAQRIADRAPARQFRYLTAAEERHIVTFCAVAAPLMLAIIAGFDAERDQ